MAQTLQQLLTPLTQLQVQQLLLGVLQGKGFPTTDWTEGTPELTMLEAFTTAVYDANALQIPSVASGGLLLLASGPWLALLAVNNYLITPFAATATIGNVVLTCASNAGPYTIAPGQLQFQAASGNVYSNSGQVGNLTLASGGTLTLAVQSQFTNNSAAGLNYVDANNTITLMLTPLPGVTCNNPGPTFSTPVLQGISTGTILVTGGSPTPGSYIIRIDTNGQVGGASWSWSSDGITFTSVGPLATSPLGATGITVSLSNGALNPSFIAGDRWTFTAPGTWVTQQGTDAEGDLSIRTRCQARWPALAAVPNTNVYDLWARSASNQVVQTLIVTDGVVPGQVDVYIAGAGGALGSSVVNQVQAYTNQRAPITDKAVVASATNQAVVLTGATVYYHQSTNLAALQAAIQAAVQTYIAQVGIGGGTSTIRVSLSEIISAFVTGVTSATPIDPVLGVRKADPTIVTGVARMTSMAITGAAGDGDLVVGNFQVPTIAAIAGMVTWVAVT